MASAWTNRYVERRSINHSVNWRCLCGDDRQRTIVGDVCGPRWLSATAAVCACIFTRYCAGANSRYRSDVRRTVSRVLNDLRLHTKRDCFPCWLLRTVLTYLFASIGPSFRGSDINQSLHCWGLEIQTRCVHFSFDYCRLKRSAFLEKCTDIIIFWHILLYICDFNMKNWN